MVDVAYSYSRQEDAKGSEGEGKRYATRLEGTRESRVVCSSSETLEEVRTTIVFRG